MPTVSELRLALTPCHSQCDAAIARLWSCRKHRHAIHFEHFLYPALQSSHILLLLMCLCSSDLRSHFPSSLVMHRIALHLSRQSTATARAASIVPARFAHSPLSWSALKRSTVIRSFSSAKEQRPRPRPEATSSSAAPDGAKLERMQLLQRRLNEASAASAKKAMSSRMARGRRRASSRDSGSKNSGNSTGSTTGGSSSTGAKRPPPIVSAPNLWKEICWEYFSLSPVYAMLIWGFYFWWICTAEAVAETKNDAKMSLSLEELRQRQRERVQALESIRQNAAATPELLEAFVSHARFEQSSIGWMSVAHRFVSLVGLSDRAHWVLCLEEAVLRIGKERQFRLNIVARAEKIAQRDKPPAQAGSSL